MIKCSLILHLMCCGIACNPNPVSVKLSLDGKAIIDCDHAEISEAADPKGYGGWRFNCDANDDPSRGFLMVYSGGKSGKIRYFMFNGDRKTLTAAGPFQGESWKQDCPTHADSPGVDRIPTSMLGSLKPGSYSVELGIPCGSTAELTIGEAVVKD